MTTVAHPSEIAGEVGPKLFALDRAIRSKLSPTPGNPYATLAKTDTEGIYSPYYPGSLDIFSEATQAERMRKRYPDYLIDEAEITLMGLHADRCHQNFEASSAQAEVFPRGTLDSETQLLVDKVNFGQATPEEILDLKSRNVGWRSIEALKYSHQFHNNPYRIYRRARRAIKNDLIRTNGLPDGIDTSSVGEERFAYHRPILHEGEIKAFTAVRKVNLAAVAGGMVVSRSTFIVDLTQDLPEGMKEVAYHFSHKASVSIDIPRELRVKGGFLGIVNFSGKIREYEQRLGKGPFLPGYDVVSESLAKASPTFNRGVRENAPWVRGMATSIYVRDMAKDPAEKRHDGSERRYFSSVHGRWALKIAA